MAHVADLRRDRRPGNPDWRGVHASGPSNGLLLRSCRTGIGRPGGIERSREIRADFRAGTFRRNASDWGLARDRPLSEPFIEPHHPQLLFAAVRRVAQSGRVAVSYSQVLGLAAPELALVIAALAVLGVDLLGLRDLDLKFRRVICALVGCVGCVVAIAWMLVFSHSANLGAGMFVLTPLIVLVKCALVILAMLTMLLTIDSDFTNHVGEFFALILLATLGMLFLVSCEDVLMIFISLELTSLSLYILTAFNKRNMKSAEAAMKYFLFGGMAAAFTLFGLSLLYGISGSTNLSGIAKGVAEKAVHVIIAADGTTRQSLDPIAAVAIVMTVIGFGFKIAAVPFH